MFDIGIRKLINSEIKYCITDTWNVSNNRSVCFEK